MKRSEAREKVFQIIFQKEFHEDFEQIYLRLAQEEELRGVQGEYALATIAGILENLDQIDGEIRENLVGWTFERLSKQVVAILRVGVYELCYNEEIPDITAIDEAVKLSYLYCEEKECTFINGILHNLYKEKKEQANIAER